MRNLSTICFFIFTICCWHEINAQTPLKADYKGWLAGTIRDADNNQTLSGASLQIISRSDTTFRLMLLSNGNGQWKVEHVPLGVYRLSVTFTGYRTIMMDSLQLDQFQDGIDCGDLLLPRSKSDLEEVMVVAQKPLFEQKDGVITMNPASSALSAGASSADLLRNMPMVSTDPDGKLLVRGKQPLVLIDDKPVELSGQQLSDLLESLPGGAIDKIELMQHPPPQYAGNEGGVINIVTKKGAVGFTGRIGIAVGTIGQINTSTNLSYRGKKVNVSAVLGLMKDQLGGFQNSERTNFFTDSSNRFLSEGTFGNRNVRPSFRLQTNYDLNTRHQVSMVWQANGNWFNYTSATIYTNLNQYGAAWKSSNRSNTAEGNNQSYNPQIAYTYTGKNKVEKLQVNASYAWASNENERNFRQQYFIKQQISSADSNQLQQINNTTKNGSIRISYTKPLRLKGSSVNMGTNYLVNQENNLLSSYYQKSGDSSWLLNPHLSNDVSFQQQIFSFRLGATFVFKKTWRLVAALQWEATSFTFTFKNASLLPTDRSYGNFLPNVTLRKELSKQSNVSIVYRQSIRRPGLSELNPAIEYGDPYNPRMGNPTLSPSLAHNFDLNYAWSNGKSYINASLGFNAVQDIITRIRTLQADAKTYTTYQNIADRNEYEAGVWGGYSFNRKLRMTWGVSYVYNQYGEKEKQLLRYRDGSTFSANWTTNYIVSNLLSFDGSIRYNTFADPQGKSRSNVSSTFGSQYKLFHRKLIVNVQAIDPFTKQLFSTQTYGANFAVQSYRTAITRNYKVSLAWVIQGKSALLKKPTSKVRKV